MLGKHIHLFNLFGLDIRIDVSWIFLAALITWSLARGMFLFAYPELSTATHWEMGIIGALGLFISILLHELSHSLVAKKYGLPIRAITLFIFGGVSEMEAEPELPKVEFRMAVMGPVMSIVLGLIFLGLFRLGAGLGCPAAVMGVLGYIYVINFILAAFNLIPAFPLDGGRVLRALLWQRNGSMERSTRVAARVGAIFGYLLMGLGVLSFLYGSFFMGIWWFFIGMFLKDAAQSSYQQVLVQRALQGQTVRHFLSTEPVGPSYPQRDLKYAVTPDTSAQEALRVIARSGRARLPVVENGNPVGVLELDSLIHFVAAKLRADEELKEAA